MEKNNTVYVVMHDTFMANGSQQVSTLRGVFDTLEAATKYEEDHTKWVEDMDAYQAHSMLNSELHSYTERYVFYTTQQGNTDVYEHYYILARELNKTPY